MRTRQEIKEYAKQVFATQRSACIVAVLLVLLVPIGFAVISAIFSTMFSLAVVAGDVGTIVAASVMFGIVMPFVSIAVALFTSVLEVNLSGTMINAYTGQTITATEPYTTLKVNFGRKLGGMCWLLLWIYLWTLVGIVSLFIPTIIKALSYSMTPYILASNTNVTATNALSLSKRMTKGHKGKIFVMGLSFIGWQLLNMLTFGILGIFYVNPYMYMSFAGLFVELRNQAVASGAISREELDGYQQQN